MLNYLYLLLQALQQTKKGSPEFREMQLERRHYLSNPNQRECREYERLGL